MQFSPKSEEELKAMMLTHGGVYDFEVESAEEGVSKKGNDMIVLKLKVFTADGTENFVRDWLVASDAPMLVSKLHNFCKTTGMMEHYHAGTLTGLACNGLAGRCKIAITEDPQYGQQRGIADYVGGCPPTLQQPFTPGPTAAQTARANNADAERAVAAGIPDADIPF